MKLHVGCEFVYESAGATPLQVLVRPGDWPGQRLVEELRTTDPVVPVHQFFDGYGNAVWRLLAPDGTFRLTYHAQVEVSPDPDPVMPDLPRVPVEDLPDDVLPFLLPSRYCPSDLFVDEAWRLFGEVVGGWAQVQAVCDWLFAEITYGEGSTVSTTAWDAYQARLGVCRDFAHLGVTFCRALTIPARYVCGYLPDIGVEPDPRPMDFHAYFEVYLGGAWWTFDARHNRPRIGRAVIGRGRDAADVAFATVYGASQLTLMTVWAEEAGTLPG